MPVWLRRLRARLRHRQFDRDLRAELDGHRAQMQADLEAAGVAPGEAARRAARDFGNVTLAREQSRRVWIAPALAGLWQDLRHATLTSLRRPVFSAVIVLMLSIGIALVTTVFAFADATWLRGWRVADAASLLYVRTTDRETTLSLPEVRALSRESRALRSVTATLRASVRLGGADDPSGQSVGALYVSANYFDALGVGMRAGRGFVPVEDDLGAPSAVVVVSERLWRDRLGAPASLDGAALQVRGARYSVVGVTRREFLDPHGSRYEVWLPLATMGVSDTSVRTAFDDPHAPQPPMSVIARLQPGVARAAALADVRRISATFRQSAGMRQASIALVETQPALADGLSNSVGQITGLLFVALVVVQLLICANVGNLLLARGLSRRRELAIRLAIGASRGRLMRQLLAEAGLLSCMAGVIGLALASLAPYLAWRAVSDWPERPEFYAADLRLFAFALAMVVTTAVACGVMPAWRVTGGTAPSAALDRHTGDREAVRLRRRLLGVQVAAATILLLTATLLTRGIDRALTIDPGFPIDDIQALTVHFPGGAQVERRTAFYRSLDRALSDASVARFAFADSSPLSDDRVTTFVRLAEQPTATVKPVPLRAVSAAYFSTIGLRLVAGRTFRDDDPDRTEVVVSAAAARLLWPDGQAVGRTLLEGWPGREFSARVVVGVAADVPVRSVETIDPVLYRASDLFSPLVLVRSRSPAAAEALAAAASRIDSAVSLTARPLRDSVRDLLAVAIVAGRVAWGIGVLALLLTLAGASAVFAFAVEQRRQEIGIRLALGANRRQVVRLVLASAARPLLLGLLAGGVAGMSAATALRHFLYGLSPVDPWAYGEAAVCLGATVLLASWWPARRATLVDPATTLRAD